MIARERVQPERQHQSVGRVDQREDRAVRLAVTRLAQLPAAAPLPALALQEAEVAASEWLPFAEGLGRLTFDGDRAALAALLQRLQ